MEWLAINLQHDTHPPLSISLFSIHQDILVIVTPLIRPT